jgi:hypothetical protein
MHGPHSQNLSKSCVVEDREPVTAQDLFSGKEMGAVLLRKIETIVNSRHAGQCPERPL